MKLEYIYILLYVVFVWFVARNIVWRVPRKVPIYIYSRDLNSDNRSHYSLPCMDPASFKKRKKYLHRGKNRKSTRKKATRKALTI